jgi:hypothetical protein
MDRKTNKQKLHRHTSLFKTSKRAETALFTASSLHTKSKNDGGKEEIARASTDLVPANSSA